MRNLILKHLNVRLHGEKSIVSVDMPLCDQGPSQAFLAFCKIIGLAIVPKCKLALRWRVPFWFDFLTKIDGIFYGRSHLPSDREEFPQSLMLTFEFPLFSSLCELGVLESIQVSFTNCLFFQ